VPIVINVFSGSEPSSSSRPRWDWTPVNRGFTRTANGSFPTDENPRGAVIRTHVFQIQHGYQDLLKRSPLRPSTLLKMIGVTSRDLVCIQMKTRLSVAKNVAATTVSADH
jgi:hypothetical protein